MGRRQGPLSRRRSNWRRKQVVERTRSARTFRNRSIGSALGLQQTLNPANQLLRLKRLANQLVRLHRYGLVRYALVYDAGHQHHGNSAVFRVLLDLAANGVAVLIRHNHVGDHDVRLVLLKLSQCGSGVGASDDVDVLTAKRDLDDFTHGRAVIDKINRRYPLRFRFLQRWNNHRLAHSASLSAMSRDPSSYSRMASSIRSVADRNTVRCGELAP